MELKRAERAEKITGIKLDVETDLGNPHTLRINLTKDWEQEGVVRFFDHTLVIAVPFRSISVETSEDTTSDG